MATTPPSADTPALQAGWNMARMLLASQLQGLAPPTSNWDEEVQWVCDMHEATQKQIEDFVRVQKSQPGINGKVAQQWLDTPLRDQAVFSIRNMIPENMMHDPPSNGLFPWPREHLLRSQSIPLRDPANTYLFSQLSMMLGTNKKFISSPDSPTPSDGRPYAPGYIHFRDIVLYRIVNRAMKTQKVKLNLITNPALFKYESMKKAVEKRHLGQDLSYCANMECMALNTTHNRCTGCHVAYYCSVDCQKTDWSAKHKLDCRRHQEMHQTIPGEDYFHAIVDRDD